MWNDGKKQSQLLCKVCQSRFNSNSESRFTKTHVLKCPHCNHTLEHRKDRKHFIIHKCINKKCPYYLHNLKKVDKSDLEENKYKYKLHYIYREFQIDFFKMDLNSLPKNASSLKFSKFDQNVMGLCLSYRVNLGLSLRKTAHALYEIHGIKISHQQVANYCKTAAICVKPFVDRYPYEKGTTYTADETYIRVRGIKGFIWFIMDAASRVIIGYQISDNRSVGPCIMAMRMAFQHLKELPEKFRFIAGANYNLSLWVAYYNFLRPHKHNRFRPLVEDDIISKGDNMPAKWQLMIFLGQQTILQMQNNSLSPKIS